MPVLHVYRSQRTEDLARCLGKNLQQLTLDPFALQPIVVGSRGMARWLKHQLATQWGVAANLEFPFPQAALGGALAALASPVGDSPVHNPLAAATPYWKPVPGQTPDPWRPEALGWRVLSLLRQLQQDPDFDQVSGYCGDNSGLEPVAYRELAMARETADVLDRLLHDRAETTLAWAAEPATAPQEHRWLARLLQTLAQQMGPSPASRLAAELELAVGNASTLQPLHLFCLSTLGPGVRRQLEVLRQAVDVHLYLLVPSSAYWVDLRPKRELLRTLAKAKNPSEVAQLEQELRTNNPVLTSLGLPSRDAQQWLVCLPDGQCEDHDVPLAPTKLTPTNLTSVPPTLQEPPSALHKLQQWLGTAGDLPQPGDELPLQPLADTVDPSLAFHATWGPMRQVEVLRDRLLQVFAAPDSTIEPRDVLVMTPDVATYAPLVAAVFARKGSVLTPDDDGTLKPIEVPKIPLRIADLGLVRTNAVAEVLLAVLQWTTERATASALLALLNLEPVRTKFALQPHHLVAMTDLVVQSGMRWGVDAQDRATVDQPALDPNTLDFGLMRVALGALIGDDDPEQPEVAPQQSLAVVTPPAYREGLAPMVVGGADQVGVVGTLAAIVTALAVLRHQCQAPRPVKQWVEQCKAVLDALAQTSDAALWLRQQVDDALDAMEVDADGAGQLPLTVQALRRHLADQFEVPVGGDRPVHGGVTVCALQPMRSVPYKLIVLLGMDENSFPRGGTPAAWSPMAQLQPGERDGRATQRHLLLETLLSAREQLWVLWSAFSVKSMARPAGEPLEILPAATPIEELLLTLQALSGLTREQIVHRHPLQPWSPHAFDPVRRPWGEVARVVERGVAVAAQRLDGVTRDPASVQLTGLAASGTTALPLTQMPLADLALDSLTKGLCEPQKMLLSERLGLYLPQESEEVPDREPLELGTLQEWGLRDRILRLMQPHLLNPNAPLPDLQALQRRVRAEGALPLRAGGEQILRATHEDAEAIFTGARAELATAKAGPLPLICAVDGTLLSGEVPFAAVDPVEGTTLLWVTASRADKTKQQLLVYLHLLVARAVGHEQVTGIIVGHDKHKAVVHRMQLPAGDPSAALASLTTLVRLYRRLRDEPLPLFPALSPALVQAVLAKSPPARGAPMRAALVAVIDEKWYPADYRSDHNFPDLDDRWVATLFDTFDPEHDLGDDPERDLASGAQPTENHLLELAIRVWKPVFQAKALAAKKGAK